MVPPVIVVLGLIALLAGCAKTSIELPDEQDRGEGDVPDMGDIDRGDIGDQDALESGVENVLPIDLSERPEAAESDSFFVEAWPQLLALGDERLFAAWQRQNPNTRRVIFSKATFAGEAPTFTSEAFFATNGDGLRDMRGALTRLGRDQAMLAWEDGRNGPVKVQRYSAQGAPIGRPATMQIAFDGTCSVTGAPDGSVLAAWSDRGYVFVQRFRFTTAGELEAVGAPQQIMEDAVGGQQPMQARELRLVCGEQHIALHVAQTDRHSVVRLAQDLTSLGVSTTLRRAGIVMTPQGARGEVRSNGSHISISVAGRDGSIGVGPEDFLLFSGDGTSGVGTGPIPVAMTEGGMLVFAEDSGSGRVNIFQCKNLHRFSMQNDWRQSNVLLGGDQDFPHDFALACGATRCAMMSASGGVVSPAFVPDFESQSEPMLPTVPAAQIVAPEGTGSFGVIAVGGATSHRFRFFNRSREQELKVRVMATGSDAFLLATGISGTRQVEVVIPPLSMSRPIFLMFSPGSAGEHAGELRITSNDPEQPKVILPLSGSAR